MAKQNEDAGRSDPTYPYCPWKKSFELMDAVKRLGGNSIEVSKASIADLLDQDVDSASLAQQISSAKAFGMIEGRGSYRLSSMAMHYYFPTGDADQYLAQLAFLASPKAFKSIIDKFDGKTLPPVSALANILMQYKLVPVSWKDRVASWFLETAQELRVIGAGGRLRYGVASDTKGPSATNGADGEDQDTPPSPETLFEVSPPPPKPVKLGQPVKLGREGVTVNVWNFTENGGTVRVETPNPLPKALWERLKRYVEMLEPAPKPETGGADDVK